MQKVICISERKNSKQINVGNFYYLDLMSINGDSDGDWFGDVYMDNKKEVYIGRLRLSHFQSIA